MEGYFFFFFLTANKWIAKFFYFFVFHFLTNVFPVFSHAIGTLLHILPSSHFSNLRIDVIASKGDIVVSYDEKTLIMWDVKAGVQKASFTADKVRKSNVLSTVLLPQAPTLALKRVGD